MLPISILDLAPIAEDDTPSRALQRTLEVAQHADTHGYRRFWLAEHHNLGSVASAATAVVIGHVAGGTQRIRVGAGGVMLPNHAPLVVAEQFGTLESLYPGRIDLGLGRAPGTDAVTARALRRDATAAVESFPADVQELLRYFESVQPGQKIRAIPGAGLRVPVWLLGSSRYSAGLAAELGLPFAFASHFAPAEMMAAIRLYRERFQPSERLRSPYVMLGVNVVAADTEAQARHQFTSQQQAFTHLFRGRPGPIPAPIDDIERYWAPIEKAQVQRMLEHSFVGTAETVAEGLQAFVEHTGADELMMTGLGFHQEARLETLEHVAATGLLSAS